jgi:GR25 family glycosyltransferase involved in LPS biosynthesis
MIKYLITLIFILFFINYKNIENFTNKNYYDKIDIIYYINLDHRTDRNTEFLNEMTKINFPNNKIKRISAIKNDNGALGCSSSHIKTLKDFISSSHNICIIFEDDFEFIVSESEFKIQLANIFNNNIDFDVICLNTMAASFQETEYNFLKKLNASQTTSGYIVTKKFAIDYLIDNFMIGKYLLELNPNERHNYAIDNYWQLLQPISNWYIFDLKIGKQRESYSDIRHVVINYEYETFNNNNYNIYVFWTGDNEMSENRRNSLEELKIKSECNIIMITKYNLNQYINIDLLHPAYNYLSETHKADYLRTYFMNFIGGGYSDIKKTTNSWIKYFDLLSTSDYWICGYKEINGGVAYGPIADKWDELIGNCAYICKPQTPLTIEWYNEMIKFLDSRLDMLINNPSKYPDDCKEKGTGYPIEWNEMLGRIFHKVIYKYKNKILNTLPISIFENYR